MLGARGAFCGREGGDALHDPAPHEEVQEGWSGRSPTNLQGILFGIDAKEVATRCGASPLSDWCSRYAGRSRAARDADAVAIDFVNGVAQHLPVMNEAAADVLAVDWRLPMREIRARTDHVVQGNLDPTALFCDEAELRNKVAAIILAGLR